MEKIHITTFIAAPVDRVYDLSRSMTVQKACVQTVGGEAVTGTTTGLIKLDETVTWRIKRLFKWRQMTTKITEMQPNEMFGGAMVLGDFNDFRYEHYFKVAHNGTIMIDLLWYESPAGWMGRMLDRYYFSRLFGSMLQRRAELVRQYAERDSLSAVVLPK